MESRPSARGHFVASLLLFGMTASIAILLLVAAAVVALSCLTGSLILSALILGGFFALVAVLVYLLSIRDAVEQIRTQMQTVYEVAEAAKTGYEWVANKVLLLMRLRDVSRGK